MLSHPGQTEVTENYRVLLLSLLRLSGWTKYFPFQKFSETTDSSYQPSHLCGAAHASNRDTDSTSGHRPSHFYLDAMENAGDK